jgi:hypothetical protein
MEPRPKSRMLITMNEIAFFRLLMGKPSRKKLMLPRESASENANSS